MPAKEACDSGGPKGETPYLHPDKVQVGTSISITTHLDYLYSFCNLLVVKPRNKLQKVYELF